MCKCASKAQAFVNNSELLKPPSSLEGSLSWNGQTQTVLQCVFGCQDTSLRRLKHVVYHVFEATKIGSILAY